jgi:hypothetical protein
MLEARFYDIAPGGSWSSADELSWSAEERRVVDSYFGDGGRNVFALFVPLLIAIYSSAVWWLARLGESLFPKSRRITRP